MAEIIMPPTTPMKELDGASYGLSGYGVYTSDADPYFDGGMFANGGFEDGLDGWLQYDSWTATVDASTVENPATGSNQVLYQNFTLDTVDYEISCDYIDGDATINYFVNDANSGVDVNSGTYTFAGNGGAVSIGIFITDIGTVKSVVDSLRLIPVV